MKMFCERFEMRKLHLAGLFVMKDIVSIFGLTGR